MAELKKFSRVAVSKLKPYENNAKNHTEQQVEKIAASINEFGFLSPVLIDKDFNVIAGHGRIMAAKKIGLAEIPCAFVEGLTDEQRRAYILIDNKLSELSKWNKELMESEISALLDADFDVEAFGLEVPQLPDGGGWYGDERQRTFDSYNLGIVVDTEKTNDFWQMPIIENDGFIPERLIGFNYAKTSKDKNAGIHFFVDDYQFERVWNYPEKYVEVLKQYECVLSPEFSMYVEMPMPMKIWNIYRSRQIGSFLQSQGIKVIPTICWAEPATFEFAFLGIPKGSIIAVSTQSTKVDADMRKLWTDGMDEIIRQIEPSTILVYGGNIEYDYGDIDVRYYKNEVLDRWRERKNGQR